MDMLLLTVDKQTDVPIYEQIYSQIRDEITSGRLAVGERLPSKRRLCEFLSISQTTIELAYGQLTAEGFIVSVPRKGYYVQAIEELSYVEPPADNRAVIQVNEEEPEIDFSPGKIDTGSFPFRAWRKYAKEVMDESCSELLLLGHPHGDAELRQEIARYLYHSRGVDCEAEQIIVGSGTEQLMPLLIRLLGKEAVYAIEDPGYPLTHHVFYHNNRKAIPIAVDEEGMDVEVLQLSGATIAYVTPSHQFPTGAVMSASRRTALLNWASALEDRYIIEDDYDSEFRYTGRPIPSLSGMDRGGNVIYVSTFSKSLMPSMRIAYMVLPPALLKTYGRSFIHYSSTVPRFDQQILARFMRDGHFSRHLNRMRKVYKRKVHVLTDRLSAYPRLSFSGEDAGMHITITVRTDQPETQLTSLAREQGIRVYGLNEYRKQPAEGPPSFLIGFGGLTEEEIQTGITKLLRVWEIADEQ